MNDERYVTLPEGLARLIATEREIRRRCRELVGIANRESWLIGSPDTQRETVRWERIQHTASIRREREARAFHANPQYLFEEEKHVSKRFYKATDGKVTVFRASNREYRCATIHTSSDDAHRPHVELIAFSNAAGGYEAVQITKEEYHALIDAKMIRIRSAGRDPKYYSSPQDSWVRNADLEFVAS